ncbi:MAG: large-conductance mechanosensitive channel protein MscL [Anaerovoracaceae bacterium]|jgi:large conductance mechanosensitive channel|nr:large-conductance mechanosensitive channel protein MscL [Anaerovoracaceae bacterium]
MIKDFKAFALKGNVIDLAVAVIIGGAFGKIVTSLVNDLLMPLIGVLLGGVNFSDLKYIISPALGDAGEAAIYYGAFIQSVVDFLIIAFSIFIFVKLITIKKKKEADPDPAPVLPSGEEILLGEIRDLLKEKKS